MILAEFPGHCDYCDEPIEEGDEIESSAKYGWVHGECMDEIADEQEDRHAL